MEQNTLAVNKQFKCAKQALYTAWTDGEQLKQWWKPLGKQLSSVENDTRQGGTVRYRFDEDSLTISGEYEKVEPDLLEYTWNWELPAEPVKDANYKLSVHFGGDENNAELSITQSGFGQEESIHPHEQGWNDALQQLDAFLTGNVTNQQTQNNVNRQQQNESLREAEAQKPPVSGYNETPEQLKVAGG